MPTNIQLASDFFIKRYNFSKEQFIVFFEKYNTNSVHEFCWSSKTICKLWSFWFDKNKSTTFSMSWENFKLEYDFYSKKSELMFKQMAFMSDELLKEWIFFSNSKKSKYTVWKDFIEVWELNFENYHEYVYNFVKSYVNVTESGSPINFQQFVSKYENYKDYSMSNKFEICLLYKNHAILGQHVPAITV
jgi:hypothetical protein